VIIKRLAHSTLALAIFAAACDRAVTYVPQGWENIGAHRWSFTNEDFHAEMTTLAKFTGSKQLVSEPVVRNKTSDPLLFEAATIHAGAQTYKCAALAGQRRE
jgi:hypothetical protein